MRQQDGLGMASCMVIVMAKGTQTKGLDVTGTWANTSCVLKNYLIESIAVTVHVPHCPSDADRTFLEPESHRCPVYLTVKNTVAVSVVFDWGWSPATPRCRTPSRRTSGGG
jgi:uncharacterized OsmC-like protein